MKKSENESTKEAISALKRARGAASKSNDAAPMENNPSESTTLPVDGPDDTNPEKVARDRILSAEASRRELENAKINLENGRLDGENKLRSRLGFTAEALVLGQLTVCDIGIIFYFIYCAYKGWSISGEVIIGWMTASLVEVIGVLWVIARSLFPFRDTHRDKNSEK